MEVLFMKKIAIMEKTNFSKEQIARLKSLGEVAFYENLVDADANRIAPQHDVVVVNWIDPTPFLMEMKPQSLVALLSTGYGWISNIAQAQKKGIYVANLPGYGTEAVAEHLLGLLLGVSKRIFAQIHHEKDDGKPGFEITNKTVGIIGLGNIGSRFAEMMNFFGAKVVTYNRTPKNNPIAKDVSLKDLLHMSDVICVTPSVNEQSKSLINEQNYGFVKNGVIIIGSTWNIVTEGALVRLITEKDVVAAFDAALEGNQSINGELKNALDSLVAEKKLFLTPHCAYNTTEAEARQLDICINNIEKFLKGTPQNIVC
jgi:lactate dehydrogenase-like 2-hydroxyacid dehydrogenase